MKNLKSQVREFILLFDYDGTLVDSTELVHTAFNAAVAHYGFSHVLSKKEFMTLYDKNVYESIVELGLPRARLKNFFNEWRKPFLKQYRDVPLFPGMKEVIAKLAQKARLIIITSNSTSVIRTSLARLGIEEIQEVLGGEDQKSKVEKIISLKERYPHVAFYYIGDTKGDIIEGRRAGIKTVAVTWGVHNKKHLEEAHPDYLVNEPADLLTLFRD
ncbi:HAD family hydrolase [Candidatus Pacearchaeota archaeon]|nr:HAD family hydrolase [Candidatus Pacearchaeota archaeon]